MSEDRLTRLELRVNEHDATVAVILSRMDNIASKVEHTCEVWEKITEAQNKRAGVDNFLKTCVPILLTVIAIVISLK